MSPSNPRGCALVKCTVNTLRVSNHSSLKGKGSLFRADVHITGDTESWHRAEHMFLFSHCSLESWIISTCLKTRGTEQKTWKVRAWRLSLLCDSIYILRCWTCFFLITASVCALFCVCDCGRRRKWKICDGRSVKFSSERPPGKHWCLLWQQISSFKRDGLSKRHLLSQLWLLTSLPLLWLCFSVFTLLHLCCSVDTVRLRRTAVSLCHLSAVLSLHLPTTLRHRRSFCLFLSSIHLYHPSSVIPSKRLSTHGSPASLPRQSFTHSKCINL